MTRHTPTSIFKNNLALVILPSLWCYIPCWSPVSLWCQSPSTWCYPLLLTCFTLVSISPHHGVIPSCSPISFWCQSPLTVVLSPVDHLFCFGISSPHRGVTAPVSHPLCFGINIYILHPFFFSFLPSTSLWSVYSETFIHRYNIHLTHSRLCIFFPHMYILHYGYSVHKFFLKSFSE